jgi:DNA-binding NarL/FixJ family response regulator
MSNTNDPSPEAWRVLELVAEGLGTGAIAERLGCDRDAVQRRLADAIRTLSARSVPDAVEAAARHGLIESPTP